MPDQWEDTTGMKNSYGWSGLKDIKSGKPFLFYWVSDQIEIIKHRADRNPEMRSDKLWLLGFEDGLWIRASQTAESVAFADKWSWVHP